LSVEADATSRVIQVSTNGISRITYTETDTGRRTSGRVGVRGYPGASPATWDIKTDEFQVVEKGGSLTSTDIVPQNVRFTYLSGTSVEVDWDPSADIGNGIAGYEVLRGSTLVSGPNLITGTSFQDTGLTANTAYTYTVKAVDNSGTRFASPTKSVFRDDFNRTGPFLANTGWSSSGYWMKDTNGTVARTDEYSIQYGVWTSAQSAASFGSFRATTTISYTEVESMAYTASGIVFWINGSSGYLAGYDGLWYFGPAGGVLLAPAGLGTGTLRVEANASTRTIHVYFNNTLVVSYAETDLSRPNSGKAGISGLVVYHESCSQMPCETVVATADDFIVEEQ
jgi:hypothetical protein